jgi:drug/metabolite transporter (DMT)-like permease
MSAVLFGVIAAFAWAIHDLLARVIGPRIGPMRMGLWIMLLSAIMLTAIVSFRGTFLAAHGEGIVWALALGLAYAAGAAGIYKAFSLGPVSVVGPLTAIYPLLVVLWGIVTGLSPTMLQWGATGLALMGALLVSRSSTPDGGFNAVLPGKLVPMLIACAVCSAGYASAFVIGQKTAVMIGEIEAAWISRATAIVVFLLLSSFEPRLEPIKGRIWWGIAAMGVFDAIGLISVNASGHLPGKEFAAVGVSGYGAMSVMMAAIILKESVSIPQWIGIAMITAGVAALAWPQ